MLPNAATISWFSLLRRLLREAIANSCSRPLLTGGVASLLAVGLLAVMVAESNAATEIARYEDDLIGSGFATLFVQAGAAALTPLTTDDCAAVAKLQGVEASFSLVRQPATHLWTKNGPLQPTIVVTSEALRYFELVEPNQMRRWQQAQVFVDPTAVAASPGASGEYLMRLEGDDIDSSERLTSLNMPLSSLGTGSVGSAVLVTRATGPVESCVLFVDRESRTPVAASIATSLPPTSGYTSQWALPGADNLDTPLERFNQRPSQQYWLWCVLVFTVLWALQLRIRRSDLALYAVTGLGRRSITSLVVFELAITVAAATVATVSTVALVVATRGGTYDQLSIAMASGLRALIGSTVCAAAWSWYHAHRATNSTLNALKDR